MFALKRQGARMKPIALLLAFSATVVVSCSSTRHVTVATAGDDINARALFAPARICLRDSATARVRGPYTAINLRIGLDSTTWIDEASLQLRSAPTRHLVSVEFPDGSAAVQGLGIGLLTGAFVGAVGGFMDGDDKPLYRPSNGFEALLTLPALFVPRFRAGEKALLYGSLSGLVGGLGGVIAGALVERCERYELQPTVLPRIAPAKTSQR